MYVNLRKRARAMSSAQAQALDLFPNMFELASQALDQARKTKFNPAIDKKGAIQAKRLDGSALASAGPKNLNQALGSGFCACVPHYSRPLTDCECIFPVDE